jgi:hypothetical protein
VRAKDCTVEFRIHRNLETLNAERLEGWTRLLVRIVDWAQKATERDVDTLPTDGMRALLVIAPDCRKWCMDRLRIWRSRIAREERKIQYGGRGYGWVIGTPAWATANITRGRVDVPAFGDLPPAPMPTYHWSELTNTFAFTNTTACVIEEGDAVPLSSDDYVQAVAQSQRSLGDAMQRLRDAVGLQDAHAITESEEVR